MGDNRGCYLSPPQLNALDIACIPLRIGFGMPYLVGSVTTRRDYRDVDVRLMLPDDDPLFTEASRRDDRGESVRALNYMISRYLTAETGLPVDFQFQRVSEGNGMENKTSRNPLGTRWDPDE